MDKINILAVDDRPEGLLAIQAVLDRADYNVITAESGSEALKKLLNDDFAVILLDVQMPVMNGFETASLIKTREKSRDIPIIFMSAINQDEQYVYQGYGVGAIDYILKPFDPYILKSKVAIFVDIYRKNKLIQEQTKQLHENEIKNYSQALDKLELTSLRRYQYLADSIPQIVFRFLPNGNYEYFNKIWFEYTGLTITSSTGFTWKEAINSQDLEILENVFRSGGHKRECECRIRDKNGNYRWHLIRIEPEYYEDPSEVKSWLGTATDIEDRKRNEERQQNLALAGELLVSSLNFEESMKAIAQLVVSSLADWCTVDVIDEEGKLKNLVLLHRNSSLQSKALEFHRHYLGSTGTKLGAGRVILTGKAELYSNVSEELTKQYASEASLVEVMGELGDKSILVVPMTSGKKTVGVLTFSSTIQDKYNHEDLAFAEELGRRAALAHENARLYQLSQAAIEVRNDFLSIASHELNTPITSLKLQLQLARKNIELLQKNPGSSLEKLNKSLNTSMKQVDRLITLIQVLLDVSRIQAGKLSYKLENLNPKDLVCEVYDRFKEIIEGHHSTLEIDCQDGLKVLWDKTRIEQVIINLITNALKYAPGKIELKLSKLGEGVQITLRDHGPGISNEKLNNIFDRFERANSNESISGLGLGLYIVKQIIDGHGGNITVDSENGKGSIFTIFLPAEIQTHEAAQNNGKAELPLLGTRATDYWGIKKSLS